MKVYVDDERECPDGWELARTVAEAVHLLRTGRVSDISLDHDLGEVGGPCGCWVMRYIRDFHTDHFPLPRITFHTANPIGRKEMEAILSDINRGLR